MERITGLATLACVLAMACGDSPTAATEQDVLTPSFDVHGNSGCYKAEFYQFWDYTTFTFWPMTGDLEGDNMGGNCPGARATGAAFHESCTDVWDITGGTIPELIGKTLNFENEVVYTFGAPGQVPYQRLNGRSRIFDGDVQIGNATIHGGFTGPPNWDVGIDSYFKGVICP
ncbi:MAG: hypothetical protein ACYS7M_07700 [Planctomycetota bacterium]